MTNAELEQLTTRRSMLSREFSKIRVTTSLAIERARQFKTSGTASVIGIIDFSLMDLLLREIAMISKLTDSK